MDAVVDGIAIDETKDGAFDTVNAGLQVLDAVDGEDRGILESDIAAMPAAATINSAAVVGTVAGTISAPVEAAA